MERLSCLLLSEPMVVYVDVTKLGLELCNFGGHNSDGLVVVAFNAELWLLQINTDLFYQSAHEEAFLGGLSK